MGAAASAPMAAATRSSERVVAFPIGAWLSLWLRALLLLTLLRASSFFFDLSANARRGWPCVPCSPTPSVPSPLPVRSVPCRVAAALAAALLLSAPTRNCGAASPHRTLPYLVSGKPSHTSSP